MLAQLSTERRLDHPASELGQHAARARDLLGLKALQRISELLRGQQARKPVDKLGGLALPVLDGFTSGFLVSVVMGSSPARAPGWNLRYALRAPLRFQPGNPSLVGYPDLTQKTGQIRVQSSRRRDTTPALRRDAGAETIAYHLAQRHEQAPSVSTIWRILGRQGLVVCQRQ